jgi:gamma-glutamyltranspeptidase/glutathione hydrolase
VLSPVRQPPRPATRLRTRRLLCAALAVACSAPPAAPPPAPAAAVAPTWGYAGRARIAEGAHAVVASGSPIASDVGRSILQAGGNAVDAAVAVGFALAVVHPEAGNIGGGGFMLVRMRDGTARVLDYRETAPAAATRDMYLGRGAPTERSVTGHLAVAVPGSVAGLVEAERRLGRLSLAQVLAPAIALADTGFVLDEYRSRSITAERERLARFGTSAATFLPGGEPPRPGTRLRQPALAHTLAAIRDRGAAGFYEGPVADSIVAEMRRGGGLITRDDLRAYRPIWREPLALRYRGWTVLAPPPVSAGGVVLGELLNMAAGFGPARFGSAALLHREAELMRRAYLDRSRFLGDPAFVSIPVRQLLSRAHADSLRATVGPRATASAAAEAGPRGSSTTHYAVVDGQGNAVSCTTTLNDNYGSAVTVAGAGFLLNDEMDDFTSAPGTPNLYGLIQGEANAIAPGKRMLSSMTPTIALDPDGRVALAVGTRGGGRITTMVYHVVSNVVDHGMSLAAAVEAPRMHHQAWPDSLQVERGGFPPATLDSLRALGHGIQVNAPWGDVQAIGRTRSGWIGVSDPRGGGAPAAY